MFLKGRVSPIMIILIMSLCMITNQFMQGYSRSENSEHLTTEEVQGNSRSENSENLTIEEEPLYETYDNLNLNSDMNDLPASETDMESPLELIGKSCSDYSCGRCDKGMDSVKTLCSCKESCVQLGNCCLDYYTKCMEVTIIDIPNLRHEHVIDGEHGDSLLVTNRLKRYGTCKYYNRMGYVNIIETCPEKSNLQDQEDACEKESKLLPVMYTDNNLLNFANIHCALCHGFNTSQLKPWSVRFNCPDDWDFEHGSLQDECKPYYKEDLTIESVCFPSSVREDNSNVDESLHSLCNAYIKPIITNMSTERNVYCALLNGVNITEQDRYKCSNDYESILGDPDFPSGIRVLFDINSGQLSKDDVVYNPCRNDEVFDPFFMSCRQFICPEYQYPLSGKCYENKTVFVDIHRQPFMYRNETVYINVTYYYPKDVLENRRSFPKTIEIFKEHEIGTTTNPPILCQLKWKDKKEFVIKKLEIRYKEHTETDIHSLIVYVTDNPCFSKVSISNFIPDKLSSRLCQNGTLETHFNSKLKTIDGINYAIVNNGEQKLHYNLRSVAFRINLSNYLAAGTVDEINICEPLESSCKFLVFNMSEFERVEGHNSIKIKSNGNILKPNKFKVIDDKLYVCDYYYIINLKFFALSPIQHYLGVALSCLSMLCLLVTIVTYVAVSEMRTIAGKMTALLSFFLLAGQILVMLKVDDKKACMAIAAVNHFVWLSVFCWMSSIAFNMTLTFWKTTITSAADSECRFKTFLLFSVLLPLAVVGIGIGLEYSAIDYKFKAGYGQTVCSWMSHKEAILIMFYAPVGISLLFNIFCFIFTLCGIERSLKAASLATKRSNRSERKKLFIYAKLSSIMGFTWIIGYVAAVVEHEALWYCYIIFNGLQGVFIFLSFICNRRTLILLGCSCILKKSMIYEKSSNTTKTTNGSM